MNRAHATTGSVTRSGGPAPSSHQFQHGILETLQAPLATEARELARRGLSAARRNLWPEALADFELSLAQDYDQPDTHFYLAMAILGQGVQTTDITAEQRDAAIDAFRLAARYGSQTMPAVAARAILNATTLLDQDGRTDEADEVMRQAIQQLNNSPELLFSAAIRFRRSDLLQRAVDLDPTLVMDLTWQESEFAAPVRETLRQRHQEAINAGRQWLARAAQITATPAEGHTNPTKLVDSFQLARILRSRIDATLPHLAVESPAEAHHTANAAHLSHHLQGVELAVYGLDRSSASKTAWVASGVLLVPVLLCCFPFIGMSALLRPHYGVTRDNSDLVDGAIVSSVIAALGIGTAAIALAIARHQKRRRTNLAAESQRLRQHTLAEEERVTQFREYRQATIGIASQVSGLLIAVTERSMKALPSSWPGRI